jgi:hypothetical protein
LEPLPGTARKEAYYYTKGGRRLNEVDEATGLVIS